MLAGAAVTALLALGALTALLIIVLDGFMPLCAGGADRDRAVGRDGRRARRRGPQRAAGRHTPRTPDRRDREGGHRMGEEPDRIRER